MDWPALFAYVVAATGWTWDYIGEHLTLPRLYALQKHWTVYPPVHIMAAIWAGYKPAPPKSPEMVQAEAMEFGESMPTMTIRRPGNG